MNFQFAQIKRPKPFIPHHHEPEPKDWSLLADFPKVEYLVVEVGCGKGDWIVNEAHTHPHRFYIGIERTLTKSQDLLAKARQHTASNLIVLRADAVAVMAQKFPDETVDELIFFYPNPTPKKRQANQRFFVGAQFEVFDRSLKTHAILLLATNIKAYLDEAECFLKQVWGYHILSCGPLETAHIPRSAFEKKYHARGDVLFELIAQKP